MLNITSCALKEIKNVNILKNNESINNIEYNNIYEIINKEIVINDNWAGQSFTLINENGNYYIYRKIFGSGVSYMGVIVYNVLFNSEHKITFSEIYSVSENFKEYLDKNEVFELISSSDLNIYLNGIKLSINYIE